MPFVPHPTIPDVRVWEEDPDTALRIVPVAVTNTQRSSGPQSYMERRRSGASAAAVTNATTTAPIGGGITAITDATTPTVAATPTAVATTTTTATRVTKPSVLTHPPVATEGTSAAPGHAEDDPNSIVVISPTPLGFLSHMQRLDNYPEGDTDMMDQDESLNDQFTSQVTRYTNEYTIYESECESYETIFQALPTDELLRDCSDKIKRFAEKGKRPGYEERIQKFGDAMESLSKYRHSDEQEERGTEDLGYSLFKKFDLAKSYYLRLANELGAGEQQDQPAHVRNWKAPPSVIGSEGLGVARMLLMDPPEREWIENINERLNRFDTNIIWKEGARPARHAESTKTAPEASEGGTSPSTSATLGRKNSEVEGRKSGSIGDVDAGPGDAPSSNFRTVKEGGIEYLVIDDSD